MMDDDDEAALLAELRAISNRSASSRFDENNGGGENMISQDPVVNPNEKGGSSLSVKNTNTTRVSTRSKAAKPVTPEQKNSTNTTTESLGGGGGFKSNLPSTFQGDRGGPAEDEELLAELRAISAKSGSSDRFRGGDDEDDNFNTHDTSLVSSSAPRRAAPPPPSPKARQSNDAGQLPPWKGGTSKMEPGGDVDVTVVAAQPPPHNVTEKANRQFGGNSGFKSNATSTFQGERGGAAEDEELLAELRAISSKSGARDRFADDLQNESAEVVENPPLDPVPAERKPDRRSTQKAAVPPWKQRGTQKASSNHPADDMVVATPPPPKFSQPIVESNSGFKSSSSSMFNGERGGAAEDEELLAELRAISAGSKSADRFRGDDDTSERPLEDHNQLPVTKESSVSHTKNSKKEELPPWKRGKQDKSQASNNNHVDVVVDAPVRTKPEMEVFVEAPRGPEPFSNGFKSSTQSTFQGERGGSAEDEELLAELRAISAKSNNSSRFQNDGDVGDDEGAPASFEKSVRVQPSKTSGNVRNMSKNTRPEATAPWKCGEAAGASAFCTADSVVTPSLPSAKTERGIEGATDAPPRHATPMSQEIAGGIKSSFPNTFQGNRGGPAEDEELLAELRAISAQSSRGDRFANDQDVNEFSETVTPPKPIEKSKKAPNGRSEGGPPWKLDQGKSTTSVDVELIVDHPIPHPEPPMGNSGGFKSSQPSTFKGERGGAAEDDELLAELRAISTGSKSSDRFRVDDGPNDTPAGSEVAAPPQRRKAKTSKPGMLPPWKKGTEKVGDKTFDIPETAPPIERAAISQITTQEMISGDRGGFKSSTPFSFTGERGGAAEDEDLLAELRAISSKSDASNRFREEGDGAMESALVSASLPKSQGRKPAAVPVREAPRGSVAETVSNPSQVMGSIKSTLPNTFKGDRGGSAEDEELLAELRAISSGGRSRDRFTETEDSGGDQIADQGNARQFVPPTPPPQAKSNAGSVMTSPAEEEAEAVIVTREELPASISDKNWKIRKESYVVLRKIIMAAGGGKPPSGVVEADSVMGGLDSLIPQLLMDKNANAVDAALHLALEYADYCKGAESADQAAAIVTCLVKGTGFTSPRPTSTKVAIALVLKLMEVGVDTESVNSVTKVLLDLGLASKKPKIVLVTCNVILEASTSFGAALLPLSAVASTLPKMLAHSNKEIRETGLNLVAEFCRALGSKEPMNGVISKMKSAQEKDLDSLLQKQPGPTPPRIALRSRKQSRSGGNSVETVDALAALQSGANELAEQRFKARPPVNVVDAIRQTEYSDKLKLSKWSEKVAALDIVLVCGGERPYKLVPPSGAVNYVTLINEMKGILNHTHCAVVSKAMQVLSMLAEGVGEKLYPNLRPLLITLLSLSKDKKLTKSVAECLDKFFGNVLGFDHLLDAESALPEALDERKEKNALARTSALDFLGRSVTRQENAGPRGKLTRRQSEISVELCVNKLDDSQATVRKAALDVLKALQQVDDPACSQAVHGAIENLKTSNARAFKTLEGGQKRKSPSSVATSLPSPPVSPKKAASSAGNETKIHRQPAATSRATSSAIAPSKNQPPQPAAVGSRNLSPTSAAGSLDIESDEAPTLDEAVARCATLLIPKWDAADEDGGILSGVSCECR
jgi:hypothetical protein